MKMNKCFRRVIALIVVFVICASSISVLNANAGNKLFSELSDKCETAIDVTGKDGTFGKTGSDLRTSTTVTLTSFIDLSNSDLFEFDVYIEDIDSLNSAFKNSLKVNFAFSSNKRSALDSANSAIVDISEQLISDGWNHIEIDRASFVENNIDWKTVRHYYLGLSDESTGLLKSLRNKTVKIMNLCESYATPDFNDGNIILFDDAVFGTLGEDADTPLSYIGETFYASTAVTDISNAAFLKVDLLIPEFSEFNSFIADKDFKFVLSSDDGVAEYVFDGAYFPGTVSGWFTVQLPISDFVAETSFDFAQVTGFRIELESNSQKSVGLMCDMTFAFANIRAMDYSTLSTESVYGTVVDDYGVSQKAILFGNTFGDFTASIDSEFSAIEDIENIEFDLYINSLESFKNYFTFDAENNSVNASLELVLSQDSNTIKWSGIEDLILSKGWNHIILSIDDAEINGFDITKNFDGFKYEISGVDKNVESANFGDFIIINNLVATKGVDQKGKLVFDEISSVSDGISKKLGTTFAPVAVRLDTSVDMSVAKVIEFDLYIQNFDAFKNEMGKSGISNIQIRLSSSNGNDYSQDSVAAEILEKISANGWNHLAIHLSDFTDSVGSFDISAVTALELVFKGDNSVNTGLLSSQMVSVSNIVIADIIDPKLSEDIDVVISETGKSGVYGATYSELSSNSLLKLSQPVDVTKYSGLQFDFYVHDYDAFKKLLSGTSGELKFGIGTSADNTNGRALYEFVEQITGQGWNRITLDRYDYEKFGDDSEPEFETVYYTFLTFGSDDNPNAYKELPFKIMNICAVPGDMDIAPELPENYVVDIWKDGMSYTWGVNYSDTKLIFKNNMSDNPIDLSDIDLIEFDIYIKDHDSFIAAAQTGTLRFALGSNETDMNQNIALYNFLEQVTHDGWNHIALKQSSYNLNWSTDFTSIKWVYLTMWAGSVQNSPNPLSNTMVRMVNLVGTYGEYRNSPALPENVVSILGDQDGAFFSGNTTGQQYHFTLDRIYKERFQPIDFSKTNKIEFDIYIDDYEKFLAAENDPTDYRNSKLAFEVSSTPPALWDQYSAPRHYFSSAINLAPYITHSGWNHIVVGKQDFTPVNNGGVDWSAITAFLIFYRGSSNVYPVDNPYADLYVRVGNIVNTGIVADVPKDKDQQLQKDKSAVYINSAESIVDAVGAWNTLGGYISTDYKTEGSASIHQTIDYTQTTDDTVMMFIFDETVDMSDIKTLKFDYFVDIPQFFNKSSNTIQLVLGNDRFLNDNYFYWEFSPDNLNAGWNEISFDIADVKRVGNPNLDAIKCVTLRFTELSLDIENFAVVVNGIDNLRYISSTGSTNLKVNGLDDDFNENDGNIFDDDFNENDGNIFDDDFNENDGNIFDDDITVDKSEDYNPEKIEVVVDKVGDTKYNKIFEQTTVTNYTPIIILLVVEAVLIVGGLTVFSIVYNKKRKK